MHDHRNQRLEVLAERQNPILADVERVVVEEELLRLREELERLPDFPGDVVDRSHAPCVAGQRLRPQAERAQRRTSARRIERYVRMQQERDVVVLDRQVALVDLGGKRQRVEFGGLQRRPRRVVDNFAVVPVAHARNLGKRLALRELDDRVVELAADDEVDLLAGQQAFVRLDLHVRADETDLGVGLCLSSPGSGVGRFENRRWR